MPTIASGGNRYPTTLRTSSMKIANASSRNPFRLSRLCSELLETTRSWGSSFRAREKMPPAKPQRLSMAFETMEPRLLLSASLDGAGLLTISGDDNVDTVVINQTALATDNSVTINLTLNTLPTQFVGVKAIDVKTLGGDDEILLSGGLITVPLSIEGGNSDDRRSHQPTRCRSMAAQARKTRSICRRSAPT
jgi:hypothetical protein